MSNFKNVIKEITEESKSKVYSKSTLCKIANARINDIEHETKRIVANTDGTYSVATSTPAKDLIEGVESLVIKTYGIDKAEAKKLESVNIPRTVTDPMLDCIMDAEVGYLSTGKSLKFPMTAENQTSMQICLTEAAEKVFEPKKIEKKEDGSYESIPTGTEVTYAKREVLTASNKVPAWLKTSKPIKK